MRGIALLAIVPAVAHVGYLRLLRSRLVVCYALLSFVNDAINSPVGGVVAVRACSGEQ